uniref:Uncharacterized protein n=1 Tax=Chromera velia CCMP2878 TaxID=1169474 RepID=A0A0G4HC97_9ALVE|eukprot:Cvel_25995.t1-p1 / transcript=Cvel_25995.t1 / gene=Cvel_25995 / organism=Chromera_velia_CCMP2878 / gene_product=hypothetical protein / transcript_product=hypothetical protein / location=Cvel_scaffold3023:4695-5654(-) / protein_length=320 / sequence_SO=supercontig / SO=protein_coding / is_pseudo=false
MTTATDVPERLRPLFSFIPSDWHVTALRVLRIAEVYAEIGSGGSRQGTRLVVSNAIDFLSRIEESDPQSETAPDRMTMYGGVREENIKRFPTDVKTDRGWRELQERLNDDGALIIDGPSGEFRASGFRLGYEGAASSVGGGLGTAAAEECARRASAFVLQVSHDGAIKLFAGKAEPVLWRGDTTLQPPQIRRRYPPSLKPRAGQGGDDFCFGRGGAVEQLLGWVGGGGSVVTREEGSGGVPFILISGIGGVGKTQLACELLHRCEVPLTKIWLEASSRENLESEIKEVRDDFKAKGVLMDSSSHLREWLEEKQGLNFGGR